jgi:hypothetical protein
MIYGNNYEKTKMIKDEKNSVYQVLAHLVQPLYFNCKGEQLTTHEQKMYCLSLDFESLLEVDD